jgi:hypothetical protein
MADSPDLDPNDLLAMQICQQGMKQIVDSRANKDRDFLAFQTAILAGDNVVIRNLTQPAPSSP